MLYRIILPILLFLPWSALAQYGSANETSFWADLTNNLATDLAPIIALFGEQTTKQFLSESTTILDTIVFAVGPLGIITAVISCIRVAGSSFLKSFVGRAREPRGMAEVELCSSTSDDVCELWSNGGICRVFGRPMILEFVYRKPSDPREYYSSVNSSGAEIPATCGIESTKAFFQRVDSRLSTPAKSPNRLDTAQGQEAKSDSAKVNATESEKTRPRDHWTAISPNELLRLPFSNMFPRRRRKKSQTKEKKTPESESLVEPQNKVDLEKGPAKSTPMSDPNTSTNPSTNPSTNSTPNTNTNQYTSANTYTSTNPYANICTSTNVAEHQDVTKGQAHAQGRPAQSQQQAQNTDGNAKNIRSTGFAPFPNLALNIGVRKSSREMVFLWIAAIFGAILQASLFGYATWAVWYKKEFYDDHKISTDPSFFILIIVGTVLLVIGMGLCAAIIDRTSKERRFICSDGEGTRMFWLQPAGQRIGDQEFDGFAHDTMKTEYIASWKTDATKSVPRWLVFVAVVFSMAGWAAQFIGLRGVHGSISLYQLGVTIIMSLFRAGLRSHRKTTENHLQLRNNEIDGHELDWQALRFADEGEKSCEANDDVIWFLDYQHLPASGWGYAPVTDKNIIFNSKAFLIFRDRSDHESAHQIARNIIHLVESKEFSYGLNFYHGTNESSRNILAAFHSKDEGKWTFPQPVSRIMRIRSQLAHLTHQPPYQDWEGETRTVSMQLKLALQKAIQLIVDAELLPQSETGGAIASIIWSGDGLLSRERNGVSISIDESPICFHMVRTNDGWTTDEHQLEAVLGLTVWSFRKSLSESEKENGTSKVLQMTRESSAAIKILLQQRWGSVAHAYETHVSNEEGSSVRPRHRQNNRENLVALSTSAKSPTLCLFAQEIFSLFLERMRMLMTADAEEILFPDPRLANARRASLIDNLADALVSERLATSTEALMTIVPGLYRGQMLVDPACNDQIHIRLISQANSLKRQGKFIESERAIRGLSMSDSRVAQELSLRTLCEIHRSEYRWMVRHPSVFVGSELVARITAMQKEQEQHRYNYNTHILERYNLVFRWLLCSLSEPEALLRQLRNSDPNLPPYCQGALPPLSQQDLDELNLDEMELKDNPLLWALTLVERYDLGASEVKVRKHLLRWGIEANCTGLVEDLWAAEQSFNRRERAFSGKSDELFWAVHFHLASSGRNYMSIILFLVTVAHVPAMQMPELGSEMDAEWWATSQHRHYIKEKYMEAQQPLALASAEPDGLELVMLLSQSQFQFGDLHGLHGAVLAALDHGSLDTVNYLYSTMPRWMDKNAWMDKYAPRDPELLLTASRWGLKIWVGDALAAGFISDGYDGIAQVEKAILVATEGPQPNKVERARTVFLSDHDGVLELLREKQKQLQELFPPAPPAPSGVTISSGYNFNPYEDISIARVINS